MCLRLSLNRVRGLSRMGCESGFCVPIAHSQGFLPQSDNNVT